MKYTMVRAILCLTNNYADYHLAHRALEDVKVMEQIFSSKVFSLLLDQLTICGREQIISHWQQKH